jgi:hypothetical protein
MMKNVVSVDQAHFVMTKFLLKSNNQILPVFKERENIKSSSCPQKFVFFIFQQSNSPQSEFVCFK